MPSRDRDPTRDFQHVKSELWAQEDDSPLISSLRDAGINIITMSEKDIGGLTRKNKLGHEKPLPRNQTMNLHVLRAYIKEKMGYGTKKYPSPT